MRFSCPSCSQLMECPIDQAGAKVNCPQCGQKIRIPIPPKPVPPTANKTTLGKLEDADEPLLLLEAEAPSITNQPATANSGHKTDFDFVELVEDEDAPKRKKRKARRREDDEDDYDDDDRPSSRHGFTCPYCQTHRPPRVASKISVAGWVLFVVLLLTCFPLCIIALFITENYRICSSCGIKFD